MFNGKRRYNKQALPVKRDVRCRLYDQLVQQELYFY